MGAYLAMGRKEQDAQVKKGVARSHTQTHTHQEEISKRCYVLKIVKADYRYFLKINIDASQIRVNHSDEIHEMKRSGCLKFKILLFLT